MNILILSAGTRNKIVQFFKQAVGCDGKIIVTDMLKIAPAIYDADGYYTVPRITEPGYIEMILEICRKERIDGVLSLIDPELSLLAKNQERFQEIGTTVVGSNYELCERSLNKMQMYRWLSEHGYRCAKSYDSKADFLEEEAAGRISFPVFVKPICGSASLSITKVNSRRMLDVLFEEVPGLMIQEFLDGQEIGADVYIDMISGEVVSIFTKKKIVMRAGETDKAVSFQDPALFALIEKFVTESGYRGQIDIDIFEVNGEYFISEVNPRFGGGYPHAYECGCDHMKLIRNNLKGIVNKPYIGRYQQDVYMMKYNEIMVRKL